MTPVDLYQRVMSLALRHPLSITGGGRTAKRNKTVGGHVKSRHRLWQAFDIALDDNSAAARTAFKVDARRDGLTPTNSNDGAIHLQPGRGT